MFTTAWTNPVDKEKEEAEEELPLPEPLPGPLPGPLPEAQQALTVAKSNELLKEMIGEVGLAALAADKIGYLEKGLNINIETMKKMRTFITDNNYHYIKLKLNKAEKKQDRFTPNEYNHMNGPEMKEMKRLNDRFTGQFPGMTIDMYLTQKEMEKEKCEYKYWRELTGKVQKQNCL